jgi:myo-inositol catabolism protein IolH
VAVIQSLASPDEEIRARAVRDFMDGVNAAAAVGAKRINTEFTGDPNRAAASRVAWLRSIAEVLPLLETRGLELRIEPHPGDFVETTAGALELLAEVGHPALDYLHCLPHSFYLGGSVTEQVARHRFDHLHIADTFRPVRTILNPPSPSIRVHQHFDIGWGELDWHEVRTALAGYSGIATVQVYFFNERAAESFAANRAAVERLFGEGKAINGAAGASSKASGAN